ncbi:glutamine amidotransferase [Xinfangfangia sp. CPCC 101601]|uniref:Glutamine amidotransferase n=1 Tax=Pseudogemmobacter lacusdianii TaxID=3069608 RepID=A0ABU0W0R5_9RHOB|nr:glutamine amidotransferase [Xinfangfangia sp. CPCC 101601]MDQ2067612.1 glutamine amidotransferase [Xinfangfangia sp. CPCC 101601]
MTKKLILLRHGFDPADDRVVTYATMNGFEPIILRPFAGDKIPPMSDDIVGSVIYGGPFCVFDEADHPFLLDEANWIQQCLDADIPLLGICQGAQQIARLKGAKVGPPESGMHEFGYYPITATEEGKDFLPETIHVAELHYHTFEIPEGAVHLASSALYPNQAFRIGEKVYGFQFHPECTIEGFRRWQETRQHRYAEPGVQSRAEQDALMMQADAEQAKWFYAFLAKLFPAQSPA